MDRSRQSRNAEDDGHNVCKFCVSADALGDLVHSESVVYLDLYLEREGK